MSERTLAKLQEWLTEQEFDALFITEWVVLNEEERKLAEEIRSKYFAEAADDKRRLREAKGPGKV